MPIKTCRIDGKPGFQYGPTGKCYPYTPGDEASRTAAQRCAAEQGRAIEANKKK